MVQAEYPGLLEGEGGGHPLYSGNSTHILCCTTMVGSLPEQWMRACYSRLEFRYQRRIGMGIYGHKV